LVKSKSKKTKKNLMKVLEKKTKELLGFDDEKANKFTIETLDKIEETIGINTLAESEDDYNKLIEQYYDEIYKRFMSIINMILLKRRTVGRQVRGSSNISGVLLATSREYDLNMGILTYIKTIYNEDKERAIAEDYVGEFDEQFVIDNNVPEHYILDKKYDDNGNLISYILPINNREEFANGRKNPFYLKPILPRIQRIGVYLVEMEGGVVDLYEIRGKFDVLPNYYCEIRGRRYGDNVYYVSQIEPIELLEDVEIARRINQLLNYIMDKYGENEHYTWVGDRFLTIKELNDKEFMDKYFEGEGSKFGSWIITRGYVGMVRDTQYGGTYLRLFDFDVDEDEDDSGMNYIDVFSNEPEDLAGGDKVWVIGRINKREDEEGNIAYSITAWNIIVEEIGDMYSEIYNDKDVIEVNIE